MTNRDKIMSVLVAVVLCFSTQQVSALTIDLVVSDNNILPGESFGVEVWANDVFDTFSGDEVLAFGFDVFNSNSSIVRFDSQSVGPLFNDDSALFSHTDVAGSAFPSILEDSVHLATLNYTALNSGSVGLGIVSNIADLNEGLVYFMAGNVDITKGRMVTVPEPSAYVLFVFGLLGLALLRITRKGKRESSA
jgi:hypothetical protein